MASAKGCDGSRNLDRVVQLESHNQILRSDIQSLLVKIADVTRRLGAVEAHCDTLSHVAPTRRGQKDGKRDGSTRSKSGQAGADAAEVKDSRRNLSAKGSVAHREDTGAGKGRNENGESKRCDECGFVSPRSKFSKKQWNRTAGICDTCMDAIREARDEKEETGPPTEISLDPRPLMDVPGFEGLLQVCRDWPPTKKGNVPGTQSSVFVPLIACVIGPVDGFCTAADLDLAAAWWSLALPAWPRWVDALTTAGLPKRRDFLLANTKGPPTPLIFRSRGRGKVPHFKGKEQSAALEMDPQVALEVYACCQVLYSVKKLDAASIAADGDGGDGGGAAKMTTSK